MNKIYPITKPSNPTKSNKIKNSIIDNLPLDTKFDEISNTIANCMITVICSNHNSGKTIGVPNSLSKNPHIKGSIFCSLTATTATISLYRRQNQLCNLSNSNSNPNSKSNPNSNPNSNSNSNSVGFANDDKNSYNNSTKITYCTYNYLLNQMISTVTDNINNPWFCSVLILDDFQSRKTDSDICLCLWIHYYKMWKENPSIAKPPKLVIMTTELDNSVILMLPTKPSVLSYVHQQKIDTIIFDSVSEKIGPDSKFRSLRAVDIVYQYHTNRYDGTYMVFLPSIADVEMVASVLRKKIIHGIELIFLHTESPKQRKKFGQRKIILATPDAEFSSITENVTLVVDSLTQKKFKSASNPETSWITMANSLQRKSKINPRNSGTYVVMQSENNYLKLIDRIEPEIKTALIDHQILNLIKSNLNPRVVLAPVVSISIINKYCNLFKKIGLCGDNLNVITPMGNFCNEFSINIRKAAMIYHLVKFGNPNIFLYTAVICTLDCYGSGFFVWPRKKSNEDVLAHSMRCDDAVERFENKFGGYSDIDTLFRIWVELCSKINPFYITDLKLFCKKNQLNFQCFKEAVLLLKKCMSISNTNFRSLSVVNYEELSKTFYHLLSLTHPDCETRIIHKSNGNTVAICNGIEYKIDRNAIHLMNVGNSSKKNYYSLVRTHKYTKKGTIRIINVLHAVFDKSDNIKIFLSESDADDNLFRLNEEDLFSLTEEDLFSLTELELVEYIKTE